MLPVLLFGLAAFILLTILVEVDRFGWATTCLLAAVVGVQYFHVFDLLTYVQQNALQTALYALGYLGIGVAWSFVKWFSFLMAFRDRYREHKEKFSQIPLPAGADFDTAFRQYLSHRGHYNLTKRPTAAENKNRITAWMSFWPFSLVGAFLNDPVRRLFSWIFNRFRGLYQDLADSIFKNDPELR